MPHARLLRPDGRVTSIELFFDLVFVFAVTQLSHTLVEHLSVDGALQTSVLLALVWQSWIYTTWLTTYLNPDHPGVRLQLLLTMLAGLVLAIAIPEAFGGRGMLFALTFAAVHVLRPITTIALLRGRELRYTFIRIVPWSVLSSALVLAGALVHGDARLVTWLGAIAVDVVGAAVGFWVPRLGRSTTSDWAITGDHFAERCQGFVLIALGESIVVTGSTVAAVEHPSAHLIEAAVAAFAGAAALWWIYFDRAARDSAEVIAASSDPGRLGRSAFHWIHPLIVAGIIVSAGADEVVLHAPDERGHASTSWLLLGGVGLFLLGHALFKAIVWRSVPWSRLGGLAGLLVLGAAAPHVSALLLGFATLAVVVAVCVADRILHPPEWTAEPAAERTSMPA